MPALPLDTAGPYVAGAYLVFLALVLIYVGIMATRLARIDRELGELTELLERRGSEAASAPVSEASPTATATGNEPERVA